jgi:hypothetical protein
MVYQKINYCGMIMAMNFVMNLHDLFQQVVPQQQENMVPVMTATSPI